MVRNAINWVKNLTDIVIQSLKAVSRVVKAEPSLGTLVSFDLRPTGDD